MKCFKTRRREFKDKIKNDNIFCLVVEGLLEKSKFYEDIECILNPKNEKELRYAEVSYRLVSISNKLLESISYNDMREIPIEENIGLKEYIENLIDLKNKVFDMKEYILNTTPEFEARASYEKTIAISSDYTKAMSYVAKEVGYNFNNSFSKMTFLSLVNKLESLSSWTQVIGGRSFSELTDLDIEYYEKYANEFERLYKEGKISSNRELAMLSNSFGQLAI